MTSFDTDKKNLTFLLDQIDHGELALPDFQRDFVWDAGATRELVRSVMQSYPAGALLLQHTGDKQFRPRPFSEAPELTGDPSYLVLDGQQRLTSLSLAFGGRGAHRYFLHLRELLDGEDLDEAVEVYPVKRVKDWATLEGQARDLALPLARLRDFADWRDEVLEARETLGIQEDVKVLKKRLNELEGLYVKPVEQYQFPVTTLSPATALEAVCTIFETLNRTGVKLGVFDLLTARGYAQDVYLRHMWDSAQATHPILAEFEIDPYYVLQVVATWVSGDPRRGTVLKLDPASDVEPNWSAAAAGIAGALQLLRDEHGVLTPKLLPYATMLITLSAAWSEISSAAGPAIAERRAKLARWFWCATFSQRYDNQPNSRTAADVPVLRKWLKGEVPEPEGLAGSFDPEAWRSITVRQQALYRASLALSLRHHPRDFHEGKPLTAQRIAEEQVDDHHIFPRGFLGESVPTTLVDCVLNRTLIDKITNIKISAKAPSAYLGEMASNMGAALFDTIIQSHNLPPSADGPLLQDRFEEFVAWRQAKLASELEQVTGWTVGQS